jgi:uncharacterized membrane protein
MRLLQPCFIPSLISPFMEYDMLEQDINTEPLAQAPGPGHLPGKQTAIPAPTDLYERLTAVYQQVQDEMNIPEKSNKLARNESTAGCLILSFIGVLVGLVVFTAFPWYLGAVGVLIAFIVGGSLIKTWDLGYVDVFLKRMEEERQKDPPKFAVILGKWVKDLPKNDRARKHLESVVEKMLAGEWPSAGFIPGPAKAKETPGKTAPIPVISRSSSAAGPGPELCPKCGSDWIRTIEKEHGKIIHVCESCSKKWRTKRK